jgi:hypothetical protein
MTNTILIITIYSSHWIVAFEHSQILAFVEVDLSLQPSLVHHHKQCLNQQTNYFVLVSLTILSHIHGQNSLSINYNLQFFFANDHLSIRWKTR